MTQRSNVVPETMDVTEEQFRAAMLAGLARAGKGRSKELAFVMDLSPKQLGNIERNGGTPHAKRLFDALALDETVLDDVARLYGKRLVAAEAVCDVDDASLMITRLLLWLQEAEHPQSPGGRQITHGELLPAEFLIRQLHNATGNWIERIKAARGEAA